MFDHFVWSVVAVPVLFLVVGLLLADRLRPDLAARVFAWSTLAVGASAGLNLVAFALKALAELPAVARFGGWSFETVAADTAYVPWVTLLSLAWCAAAAVAVAGLVRHKRRAVGTAERINATLPGTGPVVVVPDESVDAFALPVDGGRVVVTSGMRDLLGADHFAAVVAHEQCHLRERHHHLIWLTRVGAAIHPVLTPMVKRVEYLTERAADEAAAHELGDRRHVAEALGMAALRASRTPQPRRRWHPAETLHIGARPGQVPRRVLALLGDAVRLRYLLVLPLLAAASTIVWTGECVFDLQELLWLAAKS